MRVHMVTHLFLNKHRHTEEESGDGGMLAAAWRKFPVCKTLEEHSQGRRKALRCHHQLMVKSTTFQRQIHARSLVGVSKHPRRWTQITVPGVCGSGEPSRWRGMTFPSSAF